MRPRDDGQTRVGALVGQTLQALETSRPPGPRAPGERALLYAFLPLCVGYGVWQGGAWLLQHPEVLVTGGIGALGLGGTLLARLGLPGRRRGAELVFGREYLGRRKVGISMEETTHHVRVRGVTGSGKSVLLDHVVQQFVAQGYGAVVIDPVGGELCDDILDKLPEGTEVCLIDPVDEEYATGFNPWGSLRELMATSSRELVERVRLGQEAEHRAGQWVDLMKALYAQDWGGKLENTLHVACLTLMADPDATVVDVPLLLGRTTGAFRARILPHYRGVYPPHLVHQLDEFWARFELLTDSEYRELVEPLTHKFTRLLQTYLVALLGQARPKGDPFALLDRGGVLLVKGRQGQLGVGASRVLCSLVAYEAWQRFLARPPAKRRPTLFMFDEAGQFVKGPLAKLIADGLTLGRKLGAVCAFAYQGEWQLDADTRNALANARTELLLQSDPADTGREEAEFNSSRLPKFVAVVRRRARGGHLPPVKVRLTPPGEPRGHRKALLEQSREEFGKRTEEVWEEIRTRQESAAVQETRTKRGPRRGDGPGTDPVVEMIQQALNPKEGS